MAKSTQPLSFSHPELAAQWHPTKNGEKTPADVTAGSGEKVWWTCPKGLDHEWEAAESHRRAAIDEYRDLVPLIVRLRNDGRSNQQIADALNDEGHRTRRDAEWNRVQVGRVLKRAEQSAVP